MFGVSSSTDLASIVEGFLVAGCEDEVPATEDAGGDETETDDDVVGS